MAYDVITPLQLGQAEIATAPALTTIRTTPASSRDFVKNIDIANNSTEDRVVNIHLIASGGSADNTNILFPGVTVYANSIVQWAGVQIIDAGSTIQANADGVDVCVTASGGNAV
jgi:hypothetical protein